jgi:hypothetical protein
MLNQSLNKQRAYSDLTQQSTLAGNNAMAQEAQTALANRGQISGGHALCRRRDAAKSGGPWWAAARM